MLLRCIRHDVPAQPQTANSKFQGLQDRKLRNLRDLDSKVNQNPVNRTRTLNRSQDPEAPLAWAHGSFIQKLQALTNLNLPNPTIFCRVPINSIVGFMTCKNVGFARLRKILPTVITMDPTGTGGFALYDRGSKFWDLTLGFVKIGA